MLNAEPPDFHQLRSNAINEVDDFLIVSCGGERLCNDDFRTFQARGFTHAWRVAIVFDRDDVVDTIVLIDGEYPLSVPRISLVDGPPVLTWPHLEADGLFCLLNSEAATAPSKAVAVLRYELAEFIQALQLSRSGKSIGDFATGFQSYWRLACGADHSGRNISIVAPGGKSRVARVWNGRSMRVFGDDDTSIQKWLENFGVASTKFAKFTRKNVLVSILTDALQPSQYPRVSADIVEILRASDDSGRALLADIALAQPTNFDVLFSMPTGRTFSLALVKGRAPKEPGGKSPGKQVQISAGFRPGRVPSGIAVTRYFSKASPLTKGVVERADRGWIHGRDQDANQQKIARKRVAVLGCGALGGGVAALLAQAGVNGLLLVDGKQVSWANLGRQNFMAPDVGTPKSHALADQIRRRLPHLGYIEARHERVAPGSERLLAEIAECDLVISAMANWHAEYFLSQHQLHHPNFPQVLFCWLEPAATAAHAVLLGSGSPGFIAGFSDAGRPNFFATDWPNSEPLGDEPTCGGFFSPFGATALPYAHGLVSELAVSKLLGRAAPDDYWVWLADRESVIMAGGQWSKLLEDLAGPEERGARIMKLAWSKVQQRCVAAA